MGFRLLDVLLPREVSFFKHMNEQAELLCKTTILFREFASKIHKLEDIEIHDYVRKIKDYEGQGDRMERFIIDELDKTFITPLDREDILAIVQNVDTAMDMINEVSQKIEIYKIQTVPKNIVKFATLMVDAANELKKLIQTLEKKKDMKIIIKKIHKIENEADLLFHNSMAELFTKKDAIEIIKYKELYEYLEHTINSIDQISKLIRGIMVKQG